MLTRRQHVAAWVCGLWLVVVVGGMPSARGADETGLPAKLADLDAKVKWKPQPAEDALESLKAKLKSRKPEISVQQALSMRNQTPADNVKIISALGQQPASDAEVNYEATITRHIPADVKTNNVLLMSSRYEMYAGSLAGFALFAFDESFRPFAASETVKSWESSEDGMYDKVVLRDDLVWSDGTPITAHDVEFSYHTIMDPQVPVPAVRTGTDELKTVKAYDDRTVVFAHKESLATNVWNINFPVIPKHVYEKTIPGDKSLVRSDAHQKLERNPISGGPYVLVKHDRGQEMVFERREAWYMHNGKQVRPKPYYKTVRLKIIGDPNTSLLSLKDGAIQEYELNAEQWASQSSGDDFYKKNVKARSVEWTQSQITWNCSDPIFSDKRVRKAMAYTLDHEEMLNIVCKGLYEAGRGVFHPTAWMAPKTPMEPYQKDLDKAEDLLEEAGWGETGGDGIRVKQIGEKEVRFEFTLLVPDKNDLALRIAQLFRENVRDLGIECIIKPTEFTVMTQQVFEHRFQAAMGAWGTGADPDTLKNIYTVEATQKGGRNYGMYLNPEIDRLFDLGKREFDRSKRAEIYAKIHEILWDDQPVMWLYYRSGFWGFNKELRGFHFSPRGPYGYSPGFSAIWSPN